ncbi:MAG: universal stress protein [Deltaproteobacteria bacterium]|nr:universal stress protein [Deltaproteobacteria bacterium]
MALKNILVHLDSTPQSPQRYDLALLLAKQHQACLTAFYSTDSAYFSRGGEKPQWDAARADCTDKAALAGVEFDWAESDKKEATLPLTTRVLYQATYADLVIVGQPGKQPPPPRELPERLILASGHPVITVPFVGNFKTIGNRVMVAWKAGRASARALSDAIPFLAQAKEVILISFATTLDEHNENERSQDKMVRYLRRHDIDAKLESFLIADISLGDALLNRTAENGIDLLVCGGMVATQLAPLAQHLLQQMTVPVLMSS